MNQEILLLQLILHQVLVSDEFFEGRKLLYFPSKIIDKNSSFTQQLPLQDTMFTQQEILEIAALPETAFRFRCHVDALISLYKWVREQWTAKAIAEHRTKYELDCRTTEGKLRFALTAARELSQGVLPPVIAETSSASSTDNNRDIWRGDTNTSKPYQMTKRAKRGRKKMLFFSDRRLTQKCYQKFITTI